MPDITVEVSQLEGSSASQGCVRSHNVQMDRPADKGGEDRGPMGGEVLLLGLGGCFMSNLIAAIKARGVAVSGLKTVVRGTLEGNPARFTAATLEVYGAGIPDDEFDKLITVAERGCIVANTLSRALALEVKRAPGG